MIATFSARYALAWALFLLAAIPVWSQTTTPAPPAPSPIKYQFNGYVQGRFSDTTGDDTAPGSLDIRRAYANLLVTVDPHVSAGLMVAGVPSVIVLEAFGDYTFNKTVRARIGLSRIPFGYELPLSSARLITLERSQAIHTLLAKDFTFDRGAFVYVTPPQSPFTLSAGVTNGTPPNAPADTNEHKNIVARLGYKLPCGQVGASIYNGTNNVTDLQMNREALDLAVSRGAFTVISEVVQGHDGSLDANGGYVTVAYQKPGTLLQPYARFDVFDPNTDVDGDYYQRYTMGVNYYLNANTKLTAEYQAIHDNSHPETDSSVGVQYQVCF